MKTIALAAAKGGVGKTTIAAALSICAAIAHPDRAVALLDLDPQGSLTGWWNDRATRTPALYERGVGSIWAAKRQAAADGIATLFLDCPPSFSHLLEEAIGAADLVLIPVGASKLDLSAVESTAAMADRLDVPHRLVLNRAIYRSRIAGRAVITLRETGRMIWPPIHQRVATPEAMAGGRTAIETEPGGRAAAELMALWHAVEQVLTATAGHRLIVERDLRVGL